MIKTKVETIQKYKVFLDDVVNTSDLDFLIKGEELYRLQRKHKINNSTASIVIKLNYVSLKKRLHKGYNRVNFYEVNLRKPEPRHAKKILDYINTRRLVNKNEEVVEQKCDTSKAFVKEFKKAVKAKQPIEEKQPSAKKEVSIMWGLFKIKY